MKILMLTPYLPYPLLSGGQIRSYNLIKTLSKSHRITLFSFIRNENEQKYIPELSKFCWKIKVRKRRQAFIPFNILMAGVSCYPFLMCLYWDSLFQKMVKEEIENEKYDLIHTETFYIMHNLPTTPLPVVLAEQNIEYQVYERFADRVNLFLRPFLYLDVLKIKLWEEFFWKKAKKIVVASTLDLKHIKEKTPVSISLVSNGVDLDYYRDLKIVKQENSIILFVGNFRWLENRDAGNYLVSEIWPRIRKKIPRANLLIVGRDAPKKLREMIGKNGAILREDVSEIKEVYRKADLLLAPIRIGGGTKFKILEAMAAGIPVVTTKKGIEGLEAKDGREVLVGEEAEDLAEKVIEVLENEDLRSNLIKNAKVRVAESYNWQTIAKELDRVWREAVNG